MSSSPLIKNTKAHSLPVRAREKKELKKQKARKLMRRDFVEPTSDSKR